MRKEALLFLTKGESKGCEVYQCAKKNEQYVAFMIILQQRATEFNVGEIFNLSQNLAPPKCSHYGATLCFCFTPYFSPLGITIMFVNSTQAIVDQLTIM